MASNILIKYEEFLNSSIWPIDVTLTSTTTQTLSRQGNNENEGILQTHKISWTGFSPSDIF